MEGGGGGGVRLHVGGLGENVGRDDLLKIFSPMGSVDSVEFVRTKGRSFAYIDFSPSSDKSLTKLFSTYNGCVWKGGRLRLEKAKEHYLARLKREWDECSSASDDAIQAPDNSTPSTHLNIFFPRLRKVKAVPLSGTGKHKYSFQRVSVPSLLSKSFCDCGEHSTSLTPRETQARDLEALNERINEEEVHIMNSVMNKLFQKNNLPNSGQVAEKDNEIEEDLIINVVSGGNYSRNSELDMLPKKRKSIPNETTACGEGHAQGLKGNHIHPSKKRKSVILDGSGGQDSQVRHEKKKPSEVDLDKSLNEPSRTAGVKQSSDSISWSQKSSWKALMCNGNSSSFSVSSFLPGGCSSKAVQPAICSTDRAGLSIQENYEDLDVLSPITTPIVKTKIKKSKSKRLTSTIMAGNLLVADDIEKNDTKATDAVGEDHSEDTVTDISAEAGALELVASIKSDIDNNNLNAEKVANVAGHLKAEKESLVLNDNASIKCDGDNDKLNVEKDVNVAEDLNAEKESLVVKDNASTKCNSDNYNLNAEKDLNVAEDLNADKESLVWKDNASTKCNSDNDNWNVEKDVNVAEELNVAEDLNAEKESVVLKDNVDHDVDEEDVGKGRLGGCSKTTGGSSWLQRASWTQLVSDKNASFSITQLFPDLSSDKSKAAVVSNNGQSHFPNSNQSESGMKQRDYSCRTVSFEAVGVHVGSAPVRSLEENRQSLNGKNVTEGCRLGVKKPIKRKIGSGETCTFMRSSTSLKEWAKAKKALSEPRRKKKSEE